MSRLQKLKELQMHLEHARRLLDELTMEAVTERAIIEEKKERKKKEKAFTIPPTEDWESEATHSPSALPIKKVNWENDWSRRCVCGARPGRCQH
jgi:hypothetical protein